MDGELGEVFVVVLFLEKSLLGVKRRMDRVVGFERLVDLMPSEQREQVEGDDSLVEQDEDPVGLRGDLLERLVLGEDQRELERDDGV